MSNAAINALRTAITSNADSVARQATETMRVAMNQVLSVSKGSNVPDGNTTTLKALVTMLGELYTSKVRTHKALAGAAFDVMVQSIKESGAGKLLNNKALTALRDGKGTTESLLREGWKEESDAIAQAREYFESVENLETVLEAARVEREEKNEVNRALNTISDCNTVAAFNKAVKALPENVQQNAEFLTGRDKLLEHLKTRLANVKRANATAKEQESALEAVKSADTPEEQAKAAERFEAAAIANAEAQATLSAAKAPKKKQPDTFDAADIFEKMQGAIKRIKEDKNRDIDSAIAVRAEQAFKLTLHVFNFLGDDPEKFDSIVRTFATDLGVSADRKTSAPGH